MNWENYIDENLKFGLLEILIMYLLSEEDMYGYRIKKELLKRTNGSFKVREGTLYGPLYRLEQRKLISSRRELVGEKRFRNYYHLEPDGIEYLNLALAKYHEISQGVASLFNWGEKEKWQF
ncbi:MAG: PadR family transcriptional regulator [Bacilli bacterium]|nr:PadR family transcriptional regulator [Bacilli bacterium]